jgi:hypothetical protein
VPSTPFQDRSPRQRALLGGLLAASLGLVAAAQRDLHRRSDNEVRGSRRLWRALCLNALGALAYFGWGRRTPELGGPTS